MQKLPWRTSSLPWNIIQNNKIFDQYCMRERKRNDLINLSTVIVIYYRIIPPPGLCANRHKHMGGLKAEGAGKKKKVRIPQLNRMGTYWKRTKLKLKIHVSCLLVRDQLIPEASNFIKDFFNETSNWNDTIPKDDGDLNLFFRYSFWCHIPTSLPIIDHFAFVYRLAGTMILLNSRDSKICFNNEVSGQTLRSA